MNDGEIHAISAALGELRADMRRVLDEQGRTTVALDALRDDHERLKNRGVGILVGVALASSAGGAALTKLITRFFGSPFLSAYRTARI